MLAGASIAAARIADVNRLHPTSPLDLPVQSD
jgi:hypothetical protein